MAKQSNIVGRQRNACSYSEDARHQHLRSCTSGYKSRGMCHGLELHLDSTQLGAIELNVGQGCTLGSACGQDVTYIMN